MDLLLSKNYIFNILNDNLSNEIRKKQIVLNESLKNFDKSFDIFSGIDINLISEEFLNLKNELLDINKKFIEQLDLFDSIISVIYCPGTIFNEEIGNNIELIKKCINSDICSKRDIFEKIKKLNPEKIDDYLSVKLFRLSKIFVFLKKQKEKIIQDYKSL